MTDPEVLAERDIDRAAMYSRQADKNIWACGAWSSRIVGKYQKYGTRAIADKAGRDPSTIENYVHAYELNKELRKVRNSSELRNWRAILTPSHFWNAWEMRRKWNLSLESVAQHLEQIILYKSQGKRHGAETLRQEIDAQEDKRGSVTTWEYRAPHLKTMCVGLIAAKDTPEEIRPAAETIVRYFEERN